MKGSLAFDWDGQCNCKIAALNSSNEISLIMDTFKRLLSSILINYLLLPCRPMIYYSILGPLVPNIVPVLSAVCKGWCQKDGCKLHKPPPSVGRLPWSWSLMQWMLLFSPSLCWMTTWLLLFSPSAYWMWWKLLLLPSFV